MTVNMGEMQLTTDDISSFHSAEGSPETRGPYFGSAVTELWILETKTILLRLKQNENAKLFLLKKSAVDLVKRYGSLGSFVSLLCLEPGPGG